MCEEKNAAFDIIPDMVWLEILQYLSDIDILNLMQCFSQLGRVYSDNCLGSFTFGWEYGFTADYFLLYMKSHGALMKQINMNGCYWLNSDILKNIPRHCVNLQKLDVLRCDFPNDVLLKTLKKLNLREISFTYKRTILVEDLSDQIISNLSKLKHIHVEHNLESGFYDKDVCVLLNYCLNLDELSIHIKAGMNDRPIKINSFLKMTNLKCLTFKEDCSQYFNYVDIFPMDNFQAINWKKLVIYSRLHSQKKHDHFGFMLMNSQMNHFECFDRHPHEIVKLFNNPTSSLKTLSFIEMLIETDPDYLEACLNLESFNLYGTIVHLRLDPSMIYQQGVILPNPKCKKLRHLNLYNQLFEQPILHNAIKEFFTAFRSSLKTLCLPLCLIAPPLHSSNEEGEPPAKTLARLATGGKRVARPNPPEHHLLHNLLICNHANITNLELIGIHFMSLINVMERFTHVHPKSWTYRDCVCERRVKDEDVMFISELRHLKSLTLIGAFKLNGSIWNRIAQNCSNLQILNVALLGQALSTNVFSQSLKNMHKLKDLRIEQPKVCLNQVFFDSVKLCKSLQRLVIITIETRLEHKHLLDDVISMPSLVVLHLFSLTTWESVRSNLKDVIAQSKVRKPSMNVVIQSLDENRDVINRSIVDFWKVRQSPRIKLCFASHAHIDSTSGLSHTWSKPIYCSAITKKLLMYKFSIKADVINELEMNVSITINLTSNGDEKLIVTCIDAYHYPGAVMFFFEGYFGRILYTGDFRYHKDMFNTPLLNLLSKPVDVLYLDNNYCHPKCSFPTKSECFKQIVELIRTNYRHKIYIGLNSTGKEDLLYSLSNFFDCNIVANEDRLKILNMLYENCKCVAKIKVTTPHIIVVTLKELENAIKHDCIYNEPYIAIIPSAAYNISTEHQPFKNKPNIFMIPYSGHCSFSELITFVSKVHPRSIIPITKSDLTESTNGVLIDRFNFDCFHSFIDKSPKHQYHIPQPILEIMNQGCKVTKKRKSKQLQIINKHITMKISSNIVRNSQCSTTQKYVITSKNEEKYIADKKLPIFPTNSGLYNRMIKSERVRNIKKCFSAENLSRTTCCFITRLSRSRSSDFKNMKLKIDGGATRPRSNLKRSHRARLCSPSQCQTICRHVNDLYECNRKRQCKKKLDYKEEIFKVEFPYNSNYLTSLKSQKDKISIDTINKIDKCAITFEDVNNYSDVNVNKTDVITEKLMYIAPKKQWRDKFIKNNSSNAEIETSE